VKRDGDPKRGSSCRSRLRRLRWEEPPSERLMTGFTTGTRGYGRSGFRVRGRLRARGPGVALVRLLPASRLCWWPRHGGCAPGTSFRPPGGRRGRDERAAAPAERVLGLREHGRRTRTERTTMDMRLEQPSCRNDTYTVPSRAATCVKSATQTRSGASHDQSRFTRSGERAAAGSRYVVRTRRRLADPCRPARRISRAT
jgi:hypothetical protein